MSITQFIFCFCFCLFSFIFDGDLPKDEINQFVEEHELIGDLSSALLGLDLSSDQITMYMITENLHSKATYILTQLYTLMHQSHKNKSRTQIQT